MFPFRGFTILIVLGLGLSVIYIGSQVVGPRASITTELKPNEEEIAMNPSITVQQFHKLLVDKSDITVLDVRTSEEWNEVRIGYEGVINIPVQELLDRVAEVPQDKPIYVFCRSGNRSGMAQMLLSSRGVPSTNVEGGILDWNAAGYPVQ
jgi:rhodanese-related sulfurtransferase